MLHIEKKPIIRLLQFAKKRKSISTKLRPQEEVKTGHHKKTPYLTKTIFQNVHFYLFYSKN